MLNKKWWRAALIRALKTAVIAAIVTTTALFFQHKICLAIIGIASILAFILSLLMSIAELPKTDNVNLKPINPPDLDISTDTEGGDDNA